jgi:hypothetical protein
MAFRAGGGPARCGARRRRRWQWRGGSAETTAGDSDQERKSGELCLALSGLVCPEPVLANPVPFRMLASRKNTARVRCLAPQVNVRGEIGEMLGQQGGAGGGAAGGAPGGGPTVRVLVRRLWAPLPSPAPSLSCFSVSFSLCVLLCALPFSALSFSAH